MRPARHPVLIQVAPSEPGGVRDYLDCLQSQWCTGGTPSHTIALSKALCSRRSLARQVEDCVDQQHAHDAPCVVVLHFSGYGYGRRGVCFWLLDELRALRAQRRLRLVIVFHELFASGGPPWRSAFWLSQVQALIATRLARLADALWTNTDEHAHWLRGVVAPSTPIEVRPVFSNIGEPAALRAAAARRATGVVFGAASTRQRVFDALPAHDAALRRLGIEELVEAGSGAASNAGSLTIPCRHVGRLEGDELARQLQQARFGLLDYPSQLLGKSGVFAAYAAHGNTVLDTRWPGPDTDGLAAGIHYLSLPALAGSTRVPDSLEAMPMRLSSWYAGHRLPQQACDLLTLATEFRDESVPD